MGDSEFRETLRAQLAQLNERSRWYSAQLWQVPVAYVGLVAVSVATVPKTAPVKLGIILSGQAYIGIWILKHMKRVKAYQDRARWNLTFIEDRLDLPGLRPAGSPSTTMPLIVLVVSTIVVCVLAGAAILWQERCKGCPVTVWTVLAGLVFILILAAILKWALKPVQARP